ncbi:MAG: hypothetical protein JW715_16325 [Sedimentisphaerales bacterium]|nr:hypothetical protein [Sedimentisphaerales bacterium]
MKLLGFLMVTAGFIIAALATVVDQTAIEKAKSAPPADANAVEDANSVPVVDVNNIEDANSTPTVVEDSIEDANSAPVADINAVGGSVSADEKSAVKWLWYIPALLLGAAGVALIRTDEARRSKTEHHVTAGIEVVDSSLQKIVANINKLNSEKDSIDTYDMRHRIDELFTDDLEKFVDARESIGHRYGLAAYGEVMSSFAAGERYLNRVWSASADGYIDEVNTYIEKASEQFADCLTKLQTFKNNHHP